MERHQLTHVSYITPINNVPSILQKGILCYNKAMQLNPTSIAAKEIQDRRSSRSVPQGKRLHDYVNLYINPRNPMMYLRKGLHKTVCVLRVDSSVIDLPDVVVSDQNAASDWARFAAGPEGLQIVDYERTFADDWTNHDDQRDKWRHKAQMCAEVLVPGCIPPAQIVGAFVSCEESKIKLVDSGFVHIIEECCEMFFR